MSRILGVMLTVADCKAMTDFFTRVLSFELVGMSEIAGAEHEALYALPGAKADFSILRLGNAYLYLVAFKPHGRPYPAIRSNDVLFQHIAIVVNDLDRAHSLVGKAGIQGISSRPITIPEWNTPAAGIRAYYFRSPEGHPLEFIYFPDGKGRSHWHGKRELVLGIDHTAIVVSDTEIARQFYEGLGMSILGGSLNYGETQETLSGVSGAKVRITGLGFNDSDGMNLEFLHYLSPLDGGIMPTLAANDLGCTYTVIEVNDLDKVRNRGLTCGKFMPYDISVEHSAMMAKDSDGHRIMFVNKERHHDN